MGGTLSCAGKGRSPKDEDKRPYGASLKSNGIIAPSEKYIVPTGNVFDLTKYVDLGPTHRFQLKQTNYLIWEGGWEDEVINGYAPVICIHRPLGAGD